MVAIGGDKFAHQLLRLADLVTVGGIDEIAARLCVGIEHFAGFAAFGAVAPASTEIAGAQCQFGNAQAGTTAKIHVFHNPLQLNDIHNV